MTVQHQVLHTERLELQPVTPDHAAGLNRGAVDSRPELLPWMPWARNPTLAESRLAARFSSRAWLDGTEFHFALVERETGEVLGVAGLNLQDADTAELHYWIRTDHAGRGLTTEACRALIAWGKRVLGLKRLTLWAGTDNAPSRRVAEKLGFTHLGPLDWRPEGGQGTFSAERYEMSLSDPSDRV